MKSLFIGLLTIAALTSSVQAGKIKELLIETDDAINHEMYDYADLSVESISNHDLQMTSDGVQVIADVVTRNPHTGRLGNWTCTVSFTKINESMEYKDIDCR
ncbi:MAG: hypothetical protein L6Q33_10405 [Bacteriovoracaceae bacterium]|nr:hypothetical protein [Bacteriovoracaceae bacterium]